MSVSDPSLYLPDEIWVGDTLSGHYTYEFDAVDLDPNPKRGLYQYEGVPTSVVVYADGGWVFQTDSLNVLVYFTLSDSLLSQGVPYDGYRYKSMNNTASSTGGSQLAMSFVQIELVDNLATALSNDSLPLGAPNLVAWPDKRELVLAGASGDWTVWAELLSVEQDPPTSVGPSPVGRFPGHLGLITPNPFNPRADVSFCVDRAGHVTLMVYDVLGRFVRSLMDARLIQGEYRATWDGQNELGSPASSGVYFFQLSIDEARLVRKGILLK